MSEYHQWNETEEHASQRMYCADPYRTRQFNKSLTNWHLWLRIHADLQQIHKLWRFCLGTRNRSAFVWQYSRIQGKVRDGDIDSN